ERGYAGTKGGKTGANRRRRRFVKGREGEERPEAFAQATIHQKGPFVILCRDECGREVERGALTLFRFASKPFYRWHDHTGVSRQSTFSSCCKQIRKQVLPHLPA
ncbi:unnamed protein product, partial [Ectocarpus sp. 12 AP-2014]